MYKSILSIMIASPFVWGACGATVPPPTQRMADAESAERSAIELGANNEPAAQLSLKLAQASPQSVSHLTNPSRPR